MKKTSKQRERFLDLVVYEIYPRSFRDSNDDGVGDLRGVIEKVDYLKELGVNAVWLCPCYQSPNADNGYDVSDYLSIAKEFGTFADWERLKEKLHARDIKIFMDLVANHTSVEHQWFQESRKSKNNPYRKYYYWSKTPKPNWKCLVGGSAWEYDEETGEYYLHSFSKEQPDLNWTNPKVREEMRKVVDFWIDKGVDGFRCDMLDFIAKDFKKGKMYEGARLHKYVRKVFRRANKEGLFLVGECQANEKSIRAVCGEKRKELTCVFQFDHFSIGRKDKFTPAPFSLDELKKTLVKWQNFTQKRGLLYTLFTDNHDQPFYLSRLGNDRNLRYESATAFATIFFLLRGIPFLYQGQEYGAVNPRYRGISCFRDVETIKYFEENRLKYTASELMKKINFGSRDNARRPMAWTQTPPYYGFSRKDSWIPVHSRAEEVNLERDRRSDKSVFAFYQKLLALRRENSALRQGAFTALKKGTGCFVYERKGEEEIFTVVCNFEKEREISLKGVGEKVLSNYASESGNEKYRPYEIAVFKRKIK